MFEHDKNSNFDDVGDFHEKFNLLNTTHGVVEPYPVNSDLVIFRVKFLLEEILEFCTATGVQVQVDPQNHAIELNWNPRVKYNPAEAFDALIDLVYVALGTAHLFGFPWQQGWRLVQRANMAKVRASSAADSKRGSALDVIKPPGWTPPNIARLLARMGWHDHYNPDGTSK